MARKKRLLGKYSTKPISNPILKTWISLNEAIMDMDEEQCEKLMKEELEGRARKNFIKRIHCRMNKIRGRKEREKLGVS